MTISGVILTLVDDPTLADQAMQWIRQAPELSLGHIDGVRIAAVAETESPQADRRLWHTLQEQPGIAHVDITGVFFDDDTTSMDMTLADRVDSEEGNTHRQEEWNHATDH